MIERRFERKVSAAAVVVIAATYGYFLIFAEFSFLELLRMSVGGDGLRPAMGALCAGGIVGSVVAAWRFRLEMYARSLQLGAVACAVAAGLACVQASAWTAVAIGLSLGWLTVTLTSGLRAVLGVERLGLVVGLGTGLAYALCNLPVVFHATPRIQAGIAIALMVLAVVAAVALGKGTAECSEAPDFKARPATCWVVIFMALVWMDSAAFYIIQHTPALLAETWSETTSLWINATIHLAVAVVAGRLIDRGWLGRIAIGAWVGLAVACGLLTASMQAFAGAEILYTAGVSLYSVALVYYPARSGRPWLATAVFAVAGWIGSALGIGMAQDLNAVPVWFVVAAGVVVIGLLIVRQHGRHGLRQPLLVLALLGVLGSREVRADEEAQLIARGREVFIGEGCIHCHSQFVRPGTVDVTRWGPEKPLVEMITGAPPLPGNRRQGPDLAQVGNRRSPEWNRLHLMTPREVSPGSRMPSYAHLFREGDGRGDALVAYLASLGAETLERRSAQVQAWKPATDVVINEAKGAGLFARLCANCHGDEGRGDGVLTARLSMHPPDWSLGAWRRVDATDEAASVARIIKFGLPGSPMAGHEYLRDEEVVSLARHVRSLQRGAKAP
ncbi:cbb3-type cytochrome c oxidase subunit II [Rariglobus hedericola]|uniref:C-type cytochrome n=1 Tax=Rariglobus hedericola TaxID=2597822 RepID=A0A556QJB6_9BACT|nr:cbb3-type cytochrome c oxidase subunit II [Rariglobus hedericola]TSJ76701.1 c-type cytochrome [Rariglobus hedericola]